MVERKLFSLVELLIVASVIAILLAMLLPALGKARATAQRINCASNMKQLGVGFVQYQADYEDFYPLVGSVGNWTQNGVSDNDWFNMGKIALDRITPYLIPGGKSCSLPWPNNTLPASPIFVCPANTKTRHPGKNYAANHYVIGRPDVEPTRYRSNLIKQPSRQFLYTEGNTHTFDWNTAHLNITPGTPATARGNFDFRHDANGINFLFADGHVAFCSLPYYDATHYTLRYKGPFLWY